MKPRVVIIHGAKFREVDHKNLQALGKGFVAKGFEVVIPTYGFFPAIILGLFSTLDNHIADVMAAFIHEDDILVGHSNGAALIYLITKRVKVRGVVLINPALEPNLLPRTGFAHVYYNPHDLITRLSALVPFSVWGSMGAYGYLGHNDRVWNFDESNPVDPTLPALHGHSDIFKPQHIRPWACFISVQVRQELANLTDMSTGENDG